MRWISALLILLLCGGTYLAIRFIQQFPATRPLSPSGMASLPPNINLRLMGVSITGRKEGQPAWTMEANRMDTTRDHNEVDFSGNVHAELLQDGKHRATIQAESAHYSQSQKLLTASGPVICIIKPTKSGEGEDLRIESQQVIWNVGSRNVTCPGKIRAVQGKRIIEGEQLTVDLKTRNISLRNFAAMLTVDEEGSLPALPGMEKISQ